MRIHLVALGAMLVAPLMALGDLVFGPGLLTAAVSSNAVLNWIASGAALLGYQALLYYFLGTILASLAFPFKLVYRYAANQPYPDRDRGPQLLALGIGGGCAMSIELLAKISMSTQFWIGQGVSPIDLRLNYLVGSLAAFFGVAFLLRWLLPHVAVVRRRLLHRLALGFIALSLVLVVVARVLPQHREHGMVTAKTAARPDAPNILLITIDTLRADRLEPYGAKELETPAATRLAKEGTRWAQVLATSPWTGPSFATIHSGQYPSALQLGRVCTLYGTFPTLAETLARAGYHTEAVVNNPFLRAELAFDRGFQYFEHTDDPEWLIPIRGSMLHSALLLMFYSSTDTYRAEVMSDRAIARLKRQKKRPFFLWVHYMDPHVPYENRIEKELGVDLGYAGPFANMFWDFKAVREGRLRLSEADRNRVINLYEQDVAYVERHIDRLLGALDKLRLAENTIVVYVADHGEELFDHGGIEHGHTLYQELLHVPLLMRWPGHLTAGAVDERPVSLVDLYPTICAAAGVTAPANLPGISLFESAAPNRALYAENMLYGPQIQAMLYQSVKLIEDPAGAPFAMFDLAADPTESQSLLPEQVDRTAPLHEIFGAWRVLQLQLAEKLVGDRAANTDLPDEIKQKLFSLGYTSPGQ